MAWWRGSANFILDHTKYLGEGFECLRRDHIRLGMIDRADMGEFESPFLAHETTMPQGITFRGGYQFITMLWKLRDICTILSILCNTCEFQQKSFRMRLP